MQTIVVTGSRGLIGRTLCAALQHKSYTVNEIDSNFPSSHPNYGDVTQINSMRHHFENCDGIVHLAAVSRVVWGQQRPQQCWQTNVDGTKNILEIAASLPKKPWVIYASSREVYGQQQIFPVNESAPLQPLNHYARSKVEAENLINQYSHHRLKTAVLRFSSVYGCIHDHVDRVVPAFCRAAAFGQAIRIDGTNHTFDFTHVKDVVNGIYLTINKFIHHEALPSVIHFTSGIPTTLSELAKLAYYASNKPLKYIEAKPRDFDISKFIGDPQLAKQSLGWEASIDIKTGVKKMVSDYLATTMNIIG